MLQQDTPNHIDYGLDNKHHQHDEMCIYYLFFLLVTFLLFFPKLLLVKYCHDLVAILPERNRERTCPPSDPQTKVNGSSMIEACHCPIEIDKLANCVHQQITACYIQMLMLLCFNFDTNSILHRQIEDNAIIKVIGDEREASRGHQAEWCSLVGYNWLRLIDFTHHSYC